MALDGDALQGLVFFTGEIGSVASSERFMAAAVALLRPTYAWSEDVRYLDGTKRRL